MAAIHAQAAPCTVEAVVNQINQDDILRRVRIAKATVPVLDEIETLAAKSAGSAAMAQLNADKNRYSQIILSAMVDGKPTRDANVVGRMNAAALKTYRDPSYAPPKNDLAASMLWEMRALPDSDKDPDPAPTGIGCTLDVAIAYEQAETMQRLLQIIPQAKQTSEIAQQLQNRYGNGHGGQLDSTKMSPADAQTFENVKKVFLQVRREIQLATDLHNIRDYTAMSRMSYEANKQDLAVYNDPSHFGDTLADKVDTMTLRQQAMVHVWLKIDTDVPSIESFMMQTLGKETANLPENSFARLQALKRANERLPLALQP